MVGKNGFCCLYNINGGTPREECPLRGCVRGRDHGIRVRAQMHRTRTGGSHPCAYAGLCDVCWYQRTSAGIHTHRTPKLIRLVTERDGPRG